MGVGRKGPLPTTVIHHQPLPYALLPPPHTHPALSVISQDIISTEFDSLSGPDLTSVCLKQKKKKGPCVCSMSVCII